MGKRNRQPFYHRVDGLLFTATDAVSEADFLRVLRESEALQKLGVLVDSIEVEPTGWGEPEPGDPAELL